MSHADGLPDVQLSPSAEQALVIAAKDQPGAARDRLVETFLPRIKSSAGTVCVSGKIARSDVIERGVDGLVRALDRYDPALGTPFWGYAKWWVRAAMQQSQ